MLLPDWGAWKTWRVPWYLDQLERGKADVVHLQYPAKVYRASVAPLLVLSRRKWARLVTLHEWCQSHTLRRYLSMAIVMRSDAAVFTSEYEIAEWRRWHGRLGMSKNRKVTVIPIGSNIGDWGEAEGGESRADEVVYFGLIRPDKGLEQFLQTARKAWETGYSWRFVVIGRTPSGCEHYAQRLRTQAEACPNVEWIGPLDAKLALTRMRRAKVAYLPYPDGVSERRGTLLAAFSAGLAVVTRIGDGTTASLRATVAVVDREEEAVETIAKLLGDEMGRARLAAMGREYLRARTWESIARNHVRLYEEIVANKRGRTSRSSEREQRRVL